MDRLREIVASMSEPDRANLQKLLDDLGEVFGNYKASATLNLPSEHEGFAFKRYFRALARELRAAIEEAKATERLTARAHLRLVNGEG